MSPKPHHTETLLGDQHLEIPSVRWPRGVNQNGYSLKYLLTSLRQLVQVYAELGSGKEYVMLEVSISPSRALRQRRSEYSLATQDSVASSVYLENIDTSASPL